MRRALVILALATVSGAWSSTVRAQSVLYAIGSGTPASRTSRLYIINNPLTNPAAQLIGDTGMLLRDLAIHPLTGEGYAMDPWILFKVDLTDASLTRIGPHGIPLGTGLEFLPCGTLLGWGQNSQMLWDVDPSTGAATSMFPTGYQSSGDLCVDTDGRVFGASSSWDLVEFDLMNQKGLLIGGFNLQIDGMDIDDQGNMVAAEDLGTSPPNIYTVDRNTGTLTLVGALAVGGNLGCWGLAYDRTPSELMMRTNDTTPSAGQTWALQTAAAVPSSLAAQYVVAVNGAPTFFRIALGQVDSRCNYDFSAVTPPGLSGLSLTVMSFGRAVVTGKNSASNPLTITF